MTERALSVWESVRDWAARAPDRVCLTFHAGDAIAERLTYGELARRASAHARLFTSRGLVPGDAVILFARSEAAFVAAFLGAQEAGLLPVPCPPPEPLESARRVRERMREIFARCSARALLDPGSAPIDGELQAALGETGSPCSARRTSPPRRTRQHSRGRRALPALLLPVHLGQRGPHQGRAPHPRQRGRQYSGDDSLLRRPAGRRSRDVAAALSRHGAGRVCPDAARPRARGARDVHAGLHRAARVLALPDDAGARHDGERTQLRLRAVRPEGHGRGRGRARSLRLAHGVQWLGAGHARRGGGVQPALRALRIPSGRALAVLRPRRGHAVRDLTAPRRGPAVRGDLARGARAGGRGAARARRCHGGLGRSRACRARDLRGRPAGPARSAIAGSARSSSAGRR